MTLSIPHIEPASPGNINEKTDIGVERPLKVENPVVSSSEFAFKATNFVQINDDAVKHAAAHIQRKLSTESYTPRTWRTHPLHISPSDTHPLTDPWNKSMLNWIFLISSLNFSFWSDKGDRRYGVEWQESWTSPKRKVWTGYWSLVAALNKAQADDDIPITDPNFYSSETLCPDSLIEHIFRPADQSAERMPLLRHRISIMREVGFVLCNSFGGSFQGFLDEFQRRYNGEGTALELVQMVTDTFPSFRDQVYYDGREVYFWKRAQILVAETWAAFFPPTATTTKHPIFPGKRGPQIHQLTMFADYRIPQILHHLCILRYPPSLLRLLHAGTPLPAGCREEVSLRAASIVAVERVREEITKAVGTRDRDGEEGAQVSSVLIDFYLWDLAKKVESGEETIEGIETAEIVPTHRTRSIWY